MTKIKKYVERIDEELHDAKHYAEKSLECKAAGDSDRYAKYKTLATDELNHAMVIHEFAVKDIERLKAVYPAIPAGMMEAWDKSHTNYVERAAWIKQMLAM